MQYLYGICCTSLHVHNAVSIHFINDVIVHYIAQVNAGQREKEASPLELQINAFLYVPKYVEALSITQHASDTSLAINLCRIRHMFLNMCAYHMVHMLS